MLKGITNFYCFIFYGIDCDVFCLYKVVMECYMKVGKRILLTTMILLGFSGAVNADENSVKKLLLKQYPHLSQTIAVKKTVIKGIYEVDFDGKLSYTNESLDFLLIGGNLINPKTLEDLTLKSKVESGNDFFKSLPLDWAVKNVYGKGERVLVTFENPDCNNCRKLADNFAIDENKLNATVYTFIVPLEMFPDSINKAKFIYCSKNPADTWRQWMRWRGDVKSVPIPLKFDAPGKIAVKNGAVVLDPAAPMSCPAAANVSKSYELFKQLGYNSTPRIIFSNGKANKGWMTLDELEAVFSGLKSAKK